MTPSSRSRGTRRRTRRAVALLSALAALSATGMGSAAASGGATRAGGAAPPAVTGDARVDRLLARMTLDEKLTLIEGQSEAVLSPDTNQYQAGYLPGIARLGIPSLRLSDGPPGVITRQDSTGMTDTMGVAATFSDADARANGTVIGRDARALGQDMVLEPFVNMDRDTSFARGFNTFGEDPLLTGRTGAAEITGIQSQGTMAEVKHYIAYDGANNVTVDQQTLHEVYLQPFEDAVRAGAAGVMCSYNVVDVGTPAQSCGNRETLTSILRDELGFKGFVTSDWGADHATDYINAGLDMEMPGNSEGIPNYFSPTAMKQAIAGGQVKESRITQAVGRILYEYDRFGLLDGASKHTVTPEPRAADEAVVRQTGADAATLLKNDSGTLPLSRSALGSLALIGPGAGQTIATEGGGEKSGGIVSEQTGTFQALKSELGQAGSGGIRYAVADDMTGSTVPASALALTRGTGQTDATLDFTGPHALPAGQPESWSGTLTVPQAGDYWLNIQALGATGALTVDGRTLTTVGAGFTSAPRYGVVHATDGNGPLPTTDGLANGRSFVHLAAGAHQLAVKASPDASGRPVEMRLNWVTPAQQRANHDAAVDAARHARTAVVFAWDSEDGDLSKPLPEGQDQLIQDVAAVNPNTVVVLNTGQPVAMPWWSRVKSVLEMYYPGDEGGWATADVLRGAVDPGGHLPFTWPASLDQELAHQSGHPERSSAGVGGNPNCSFFPPNTALDCPVTTYSEGVDIGYRFFQATGETPLLPFGAGLSYTSFRYSGLTTAQAPGGRGLAVSFRVTNTGGRAGDAVPQIYLGAPQRPPAGVRFAPRTLAGYARVALAPGESRTVTITVPARQLQYWSTEAGRWATASGPRAVSVAPDANAAGLTGTVNVRG
ncbi:beta-glucosidase family protein [Phaeacidiphilus oryzae]|uniref:beta-glucosidase family protein n=1 Tax=Phaeacidiphilus oryzae TaxID=348818 RepID=UPI001F1B2B52|nr:glycoside hydrolase family 3 C-terminal domain-containing protein [Phaeacidiphilus oryzae]